MRSRLLLLLVGVICSLALAGCEQEKTSANEGYEIATVEWSENVLSNTSRKVNDVDQRAAQLEKEIASLQAKINNSTVFKDVPKGYWAYIEIMNLYNKGIISGYPEEKKFYPENEISRYQAASMLIKALNLPKSTNQSVFTDVPSGHWTEEVVMTVYDAGLFKGSNGNFMPTAPMKRIHMATVLQRAFDLQDNGDEFIPYVDVLEGSEGYEVIKIISQHDIAKGSNGYFSPNNPTRRSHFSAFLTRALSIETLETKEAAK
ncbi:S-layer homology domain-containing protein [Bacillus salitolerans]|uniref:S-layer homology domain-containing protein n=1 Tax=Bacillus salitolerans TaxID=1437434 RepID=A0ABW4LNS1_9BACI